MTEKNPLNQAVEILREIAGIFGLDETDSWESLPDRIREMRDAQILSPEMLMALPLARYIVIPPEGEIRIERRSPWCLPATELLQADVGGLIQEVSAFCPPGINAYANENSWALRLKPNPLGSQVVGWKRVDPFTGIAEEAVVDGPVVILAGFLSDDQLYNLEDWDGDFWDDPRLASVRETQAVDPRTLEDPIAYLQNLIRV